MELKKKYNISFSVRKIAFIYLIAPTDFTNDQNNLSGVIWGYIDTLSKNASTITLETLLSSLIYKISLRNLVRIGLLRYQEKNV